VPEVSALTPEILAMAGDATTAVGTGGMTTKLAAAKIALASGCRMVIAAGKHAKPLTRIDELQKNTWFIPTTTPTRARKNWIAQHLQTRGALTIDAGAESALAQGKSLLAAGIIKIEGDFQKGDAVSILNMSGVELARGLTNYPVADAKKILGQHSAHFEKILGYSGNDTIIHRNDLILLTEAKE
jgi:glutamate 5-kinase